mgnify:CR=1 FL=1
MSDVVKRDRLVRNGLPVLFIEPERLVAKRVSNRIQVETVLGFGAEI